MQMGTGELKAGLAPARDYKEKGGGQGRYNSYSIISKYPVCQRASVAISKQRKKGFCPLFTYSDIGTNNKIP